MRFDRSIFNLSSLKRNYGMCSTVSLLLLVSCEEPDSRYGIVLDDSTYIPDIREIKEPIWLANGNSVALPFGSYLIVRDGAHIFAISISLKDAVTAVSINKYLRSERELDLVEGFTEEIDTREISLRNPKTLRIGGSDLGDMIDVNMIILKRPRSYSWSPHEITESDLSELVWQ